MDFLFKGVLQAVGAAILAFVLGLLGLGCVAQGQMTNGEVTVQWRPALVWTVKTGLYFYGGEELPLKVVADIEGSAHTDAEPAPN